jgi:hypothetical protein
MHMIMQVSVVFLLLCFGICCAEAAHYGAKRRVEASSDSVLSPALTEPAQQGGALTTTECGSLGLLLASLAGGSG